MEQPHLQPTITKPKANKQHDWGHHWMLHLFLSNINQVGQDKLKFQMRLFDVIFPFLFRITNTAVSRINQSL